MFGFFKRTSQNRPKSTLTDAVYDFLYCDSRRVASFLAQFNPAELNFADEESVGNNIWMTLDPAAMVVPAEDLLLKYGLSVSGRWKMLAIKDASADEGAEIDFGLMSSIHALNYGEVAEARGTTTIALFSEVYSPFARKLLGRPGAFHGVTPILIFREIGPAPMSTDRV